GYPVAYLYGQNPLGASVESVPSGSLYHYYVSPSSTGSSIPTGAPFSYVAVSYYNFNGTVYTNLPEGVPAYVGVQFDTGAGTQFGWIGVVRTGRSLDAFAWGFESTPNTPIAAGAAGSTIGNRGDVNCDGTVDEADVPLFVQALINPNA